MKLYLPFVLIFIVSCDSNQDVDSSVNSQQIIWLEDQAKEYGITAPWVSGAVGNYNMPEIIGGGAAMIDYDMDGDLDLYLVQGGYLDNEQTVSNMLFRNDGDTFTDVSLQSGADHSGYGMGVTAGDYDNDGFTDLYVTNLGKNVLLHNNGNGTFSDVTDVAGVGDDGWGASAAFVDLDADGDLDIFVTNYIMWEHGLKITCFNAKGSQDYCAPINYMAPEKDVVYKNNGDGTFTDMTRRAGLGVRVGTGLGVLCNDYTGDGRIDIFVANDGMADQLWENNGDWTFTDVAPLRGCALDDEGRAKAGMGVTSADFDHDGDFDILVCNLYGESDSLFRNDGEYFTDITSMKGIRSATRHATRFGLGWVDFDNDSILDLYEANGRVQLIGTPFTDDPYAEPNHLLQGTHAGWSKIDAIKSHGIHTSRAAVFGDINNDGGIDIFVVNKDAPPYLLINVHPNRTHSVTLQVLNEFGSDALGAFVTAKLGSINLTKPVQSTWSYMAANDPRVHIGLGGHEQIDDVTVHYVDGSTKTFGSFKQGFHTLQK
jgi:hypothetical protein